VRIVRAILGAIILFFDRLFSPKGIVRAPEYQRFIDAQTTTLALYQFEACPFCVKVRRYLKRRSLTIELRNADENETWKRELITEGGEYQVPCLRIEGEGPDGKPRWLYESDDIIAYLDKRFPDQETKSWPKDSAAPPR
jgi:glutaredoxin